MQRWPQGLAAWALAQLLEKGLCLPPFISWLLPVSLPPTTGLGQLGLWEREAEPMLPLCHSGSKWFSVTLFPWPLFIRL